MPITTHKNNIPFEYPKTINTISQDWLFGHNTFLNIDSRACNHSPTLVYTSLLHTKWCSMGGMFTLQLLLKIQTIRVKRLFDLQRSSFKPHINLFWEDVRLSCFHSKIYHWFHAFSYHMYYGQEFSSILLGRWVGNYPREDLAKFGYKSENNLEIFIKPHYILATCKKPMV